MTHLLTWPRLRIIAALAPIMACLLLVGCALSHSTTRTTADGVTRTNAFSAGFLSDQPSSSESSPDTAKASSGGTHRPSAATMAMKPVITAGIFLTVIGGILTLIRFKLPVIPLGASLGVAALGVGLILLGGFVPALAENLWLIVILGVVGLVMWSTGLFANIRDRFSRSRDDGSSE